MFAGNEISGLNAATQCLLFVGGEQRDLVDLL